MSQVFNDHYPVSEYLSSYLQIDEAFAYRPQGLPPTPAIYLLHGISLGFIGSMLKKHLAMQLIVHQYFKGHSQACHLPLLCILLYGLGRPH